VRYLVIGGQAAILYGAAHFSQDLDLWVDPAPPNVARLVGALEDLGARVHKLTPPLTQSLIRRGHAFHFVVPQPDGRLYLDIMGCPPRSTSFGRAWRRSERMATPWGRLPVVSIGDLVELKKTNRPTDYDVITRLAMIRAGARPGRALLRWAASNVFRAEDLWELVRRFPAVGAFGPAARAERSPTASEMDAVARRLAARAQALQARGRRYWLPRIDELRRMRSDGVLLTEGAPVTRAVMESGGRPSD
jgi:hypothetical protein